MSTGRLDHPKPDLLYDEYQVPCLEVLKENRKNGTNTQLIVMAGGLGKTIIAAREVKDYFNDSTGRVLVLCHDTNILEQSCDKFFSVLGREYSLGLFHGSEKTFRPVDVMFASFQTMEGRKQWKKTFKPDEFEYVIVDEAHHSRARTFESVIRYFTPKFLLGLTATPNREDGKPLDEIFGEAVYKLEYIDALVKGYLTPIEYNLMTYELDNLVNFAGIEANNIRPLSLRELNERVATQHSPEELAADIMSRLSSLDNPRTTVFCSSISDVNTFASLIGEAVPLHSGLPAKVQAENLSKFRTGEVHTIVVMNQFNEGIDVPEIDVIVRLRQTSSRIVFQQQLFRGARRSEGKEKLIVFDYVSSAEQLEILFDFEREFTEKTESLAGTPNAPRTPAFRVTISGGNWAVEKVNILKILERTKNRLTRQELIDKLKALGERLGKTPSAGDINNAEDMPSQTAYLLEFGDIASAQIAAGFKPNSKRNAYTESSVLEALVNFTLQNKRPPMSTELQRVKELNLPCLSIVTSFLGSPYSTIVIGKLKAALAGKDDGIIWDMKAHKKELQKQAAIDAYLDMVRQLGRYPTYAEMEANKKFPSKCGLAHLFGTCTNFLDIAKPLAAEIIFTASEKATVEKNSPEFIATRERFIARLQQLGTELGRTPRSRDAHYDPECPNPEELKFYFGSFPKYLLASGYLPNTAKLDAFNHGMKHSEDELVTIKAILIKDLQNEIERIGYVPSSKEFDRIRSDGVACSGSYRNIFGSWNNAIYAAGYEPTHKGNPRKSK